jgi:glyoxylase-like metal-dependent hydrolase (beta-lactamase superfamily II)
MCGNHSADGSPTDHSHIGHGDDDRPVFMPLPRAPRTLRRRAFLGDVGKGTVAFAVLTPAAIAAACSSSDGDSAAAPGSTTSTFPSTTTTEASAGTADESTTTEAIEDAPGPVPLQWARANLGFVSAYVLVRGTEAAIVDTGVSGSADDIGATLADMGLGYGDVRHVILTHLHGDHVGSTSEVMAMASSATAWAGEADIGGIPFDDITIAADGADVFGTEIVATPGHTAGHISVYDRDAGLLVAGDAINTLDGGVQGPNPGFTDDIDLANDSARRLAELSFNTLLAGHGDPVEDKADTAVQAMAASL